MWLLYAVSSIVQSLIIISETLWESAINLGPVSQNETLSAWNFSSKIIRLQVVQTSKFFDSECTVKVAIFRLPRDNLREMLGSLPFFYNNSYVVNITIRYPNFGCLVLTESTDQKSPPTDVFEPFFLIRNPWWRTWSKNTKLCHEVDKFMYVR